MAKSSRLEITYRPVESLIPYARNARTHSEAQIEQIAASIETYSFTNPVLIGEDDGIVAGHGRVLAARQLGMAEVPCVRLSHLTPAQRRAYVLADNQLALNAGWDEELLAMELGELRDDDADLALIGFSDAELHRLLKDEFEPGGLDDQGQLDVTDAKTETCPHCGGEL